MAVLSIQSHVVYGHAGNSAAVFPMQRLGREVWAVNTVEFSNHTGFGGFRGKVLGAELVTELVKGLEERGVLHRCEAVLSGYLGDAAVGRAVIDAVHRVRRFSPKALYCCDPVMGDTGKGFYVKPDIPGMFRNEVTALADIVTPNQFELEALTGIKADTADEARRAIGALHAMGPGIVLVTSYRGAAEKNAAGSGGDPAGGAAAGGAGQISMLVSDRKDIYQIRTPELPLGTGLAGSGDLTASIFLSRYLETGNVKKTLELCTASVYGILEASFFAAGGADKPEGADNSGGAAPLELRIIQAQDELCSPSRAFEALRLPG
jgi:pyridoxine kinase